MQASEFDYRVSVTASPSSGQGLVGRHPSRLHIVFLVHSKSAMVLFHHHKNMTDPLASTSHEAL